MASFHLFHSSFISCPPLFSLVAALDLLAISHAASAQTATLGPNARQANQHVRIRQGVASGELTRPEAAHLKAREADIREDKQNAQADGVVTRNERKEIRNDKNKTSRVIYRQKHDGQEQSRTR